MYTCANPSPDAVHCKRQKLAWCETAGCSVVKNNDLKHEMHQTWCVVQKLSFIYHCQSTRQETFKPSLKGKDLSSQFLKTQ